MKLISNPTEYGARTVNLRCPKCLHNGAFEAAGINDVAWTDGRGGVNKYGLRRCPNPECYESLFVVFGTNGRLLISYPPEVIDFDATNLPERIKDSLSEAVQCHASGCYKASAIMIRRTLEELCADKKATGANLKERLQALEKVVVVPRELLAAADALRLLGNDAAHLESNAYDQIGKDEIELGISLTKELLKGIYQYSALLKALQARQKATS